MSVRDFPDIDAAQCHYNDTLKRKPFEIRAAIARSIAAGAIIKLVSKREGGPFYAPAGYVDSADRLDNSDLVFGRDYSGQYDAPIWRDDA
jgi:hypothetical protein